jgi:hypothetical protein
MMAEQPKSKAAQLREDLMRHPLTPEEVAQRYPKVEALRLRSDAPSVEIDDALPAKRVIEQLQSEDVDAIALHEQGSDPTAVIIPVERYLELVGKELAGYTELVGTLDGRLIPPGPAFAASYVEPVDPDATWRHGDTTLLH